MNYEITTPGGKKIRHRKLAADWTQAVMPGGTPNRIITSTQAERERESHHRFMADWWTNVRGRIVEERNA